MKSESVFLKYMKNLRGKQILLLLIALGILLLLLGSRFNGSGSGTAEASVNSAEQYEEELEARLTVLCGEVRGVGQLRLMVTLEEGERRSYSGSNLLSSEMPLVKGVAVVCTGGGNPTVQSELTELLTSLLGIGSHRVHISEMKQAY